MEEFLSLSCPDAGVGLGIYWEFWIARGAQDSLASSGALIWPSRDPGDGQDPVLKCK